MNSIFDVLNNILGTVTDLLGSLLEGLSYEFS